MAKQDVLPFRLARPPFGRPETRAQVFLSAACAERLRSLVDRVSRGQQVVVVSGEAGVGKTVLLDVALGMFRDRDFDVIRVGAPTPTPLVFQRLIGDAAGVDRSKMSDPDTLCDAIRATGRTKPIVLAVDDAHTLPLPTLNYLWLMISLLDLGPLKLRLVLVGRLELDVKLRDPQLSPLRDASGVTILVPPLADDEVEAYLDHRLRQAGGSLRRVMSDSAIEELLEQSGGIPGELDLFARRTLALGPALGTGRLTRKTVLQAMAGRDPRGQGRHRVLKVSLALGGAIAAAAVIAVIANQVEQEPNASLQAWLAGRDLSTPTSLSTAQIDPAPPAAQSPVASPPATLPQPPASAQAAISPTALAMAQLSASLALPRPVTPAPAVAQPGRPLNDQAGSSPAQSSSSMLPERERPRDRDRASSAGKGLVLLAKAGDSVSTLYHLVYRGLTPPPYEDVVAANPTTPHAGDLLVFPAPPNGWKN